MSSRDYRDFIEDIKNSIKFIFSFTENITFDMFEEDIKTQFAVIRCFEIIGEGTKRIPQEFKDLYPEIPWKIMASMRDRLIHGYDVVNTVVLWKTIQKDIPALSIQMNKINIE